MKRDIMLRLLIFMIGLFLTVCNSSGQQPVILNDSVFSKILNEQRKLKIFLPGEIRQGSGTKYDVVYILDGEAHFNDFIYITNFALNQKLIPPIILIAVENSYTSEGSMRDRDFIPGKTPGNNKAGGADKFISFLKTELIPFVNSKLPSSGENSLFGHSLGGLFTFYVLLKEPGLFSNYFSSDPSFPWNDRLIIKMTENVFKNPPELDKTLLVIGTEETWRNVGIEMMDSVLKALAPEDLRWKTSIYPNETHMSVRLKGIYDGLRYAYNGYNSTKLVEFHPNNGSLLKGKPTAVFLNGSFRDVRYTLDGSEPDKTSPEAPQKIDINGPCIIRIKWLGDNKKYITTSTGNFELSSIWPALKTVKGIKQGGLHYSYFEGKWDSLPDFTGLKAARAGIADSSFSFEQLPSRSDFGCVFEGYIRIDSDGYYSFALCSRDGSRFFINDHEIINNDGLHGSDWYKSYLVPLQRGFYPVRIEYFLSTGNPHFDLIYFSPDNPETINLTFNKMYYKK